MGGERTDLAANHGFPRQTTVERRGDGERMRLGESLQEFIRMYEPHEAREDTVLFPHFARSFRNTNTTRSAKTLREKSTSSSAKEASRKWWTMWQASKSDWAFMN
jgi:hypothetical protein